MSVQLKNIYIYLQDDQLWPMSNREEGFAGLSATGIKGAAEHLELFAGLAHQLAHHVLTFLPAEGAEEASELFHCGPERKPTVCDTQGLPTQVPQHATGRDLSCGIHPQNQGLIYIIITFKPTLLPLKCQQKSPIIRNNFQNKVRHFPPHYK